MIKVTLKDGSVKAVSYTHLAIGVMVANAANALGMKVFGYDPYLSVKSAWNLTHNAVHIFDINEIFEKCDYITVHVPLTDSTKNLINATAIAKMRDGVRIFNFARGGLVNSADLLAALESGKVASYVTDFPSDDILGAQGDVYKRQGEWNTMVEDVRLPQKSAVSAAPRPAHTFSATPLSQINAADEHRFVTGISELDRVLGGGIVKGSVILLSGDPGIGKSTILLQVCNCLLYTSCYQL